MRAILIQLLRVSLALLLIYAVLIAVSLLLFPWPISSVVDTKVSDQTVFETPAKYVFLNRGPLQRPGKRVIFLGASNTVMGFPVPSTQREIPNALVNDMAVNGGNVTEVHQVFKLSYDAMTPESRAGTVYVIGLWYGLFIDDAVKWSSFAGKHAQTDIDAELYRYGFFRKTDHGPVRVIPDDKLWIATTLIYPLIATEKIVRLVTGPVRERFLGALPDLTDAERNAYVATKEDEESEKKLWITSFAKTGVSTQQLRELQALVNEAEAGGSSVVIADLPIPSWHSAALPYDAQYARLLAGFLEVHKDDRRLIYANLRDLNSNGYFSDEVHPKPSMTPVWIRRVAGYANAAIAQIGGGQFEQ